MAAVFPGVAAAPEAGVGEDSNAVLVVVYGLGMMFPLGSKNCPFPLEQHSASSVQQ